MVIIRLVREVIIVSMTHYGLLHDGFYGGKF